MNQPTNSLVSLEQWLAYLEQCHPSTIELGLERISKVADKLAIDFSSTRIITVGGTNGKGSTVAMLSSILEQGGYKTACYTSPHILHYNERVRLGKRLATDAELCHSFAEVEKVRGDIQLTYFEFGTLAALQIFSEYNPDFVLLEVGLGGRLDAVNILDPDLAIVTNVAIDHTDWLGDTREAIGFEKAGIFRTNVPALIGEQDIPVTVLDHADSIAARVFQNGKAFFHTQTTPDLWQWQGLGSDGNQVSLADLPINTFPLDNCATVLQAISLVAPEIKSEQIVAGLGKVSLDGRFQRIDRSCPLILDVAHNPHAAGRLVEQLGESFPGFDIHLVVAMLADKNYREVLDILGKLEPAWYVAGIQEDRGLEGKILYNYLSESGKTRASSFATVEEAFIAAEQAIKSNQNSRNNALLVVTGSFFTVATVMELL